MTMTSTMTLETFKRQMLPLLETAHGQGQPLAHAIKRLTEQTRIVDELGQELDIDTLVLQSQNDDQANAQPAPNSWPAGWQEQVRQIVQRAMTRQGRSARETRPGAMVSDYAPLAPASGFDSLGEFAVAVHKASQQGGRVDARLITKAPSTYANQTTGASGGYMVPTEFTSRLWELVFAPESLLARTSQIPTVRNSLSLPVSQSTPWGASGVQANWVEEGGAIPQTKPSFAYRNLRLHKLAALVPASDELIEDAAALDAFVTRQAGRAIRHQADHAILNGDGLGKPLGIFNSPALVSVAKESGQANDTIVANNIAKMFARMPASSINQAVWLLGQDALPQVVTLTLNGRPIYQPPTGQAGAPLGTLLGRPLVLSEHCQSLGDKGDIFFLNFQDYITLTRTSGIQSASSVHLWFDHDITAFRFTFRIAGQPWLDAPITPANNGASLSPFVTLDAR